MTLHEHKKCEDCGKCRGVTTYEVWCLDCGCWGCERGDNCTDPVTARDLLGIAPDWTGGKSVDESVDEQRDRNPE